MKFHLLMSENNEPEWAGEFYVYIVGGIHSIGNSTDRRTRSRRRITIS
jgi:hypothetical protein